MKYPPRFPALAILLFFIFPMVVRAQEAALVSLSLAVLRLLRVVTVKIV